MPHLPQYLAHLEQGRTSEAGQLVTELLDASNWLADGMTLSVLCSEEMPFNDPASVSAAGGAFPPALAQFARTAVEEMQAQCAVWQVEPAAALENEPVRSDIPTLLLVGDYDPVTPPDYARDAVQYLSNGHLVEYTGVSHGVFTESCAMEMIVAFLADPSAAPAVDCRPSRAIGFLAP
jgi:pimeloyl-ACP methyl ester carboxylesterase